MSIFSNRIRKEELKHGDHIYSWRSAYIYAHHGIYVAENRVIHFSPGRNGQLGTFVVSSSRPACYGRCPDCGLSGDSNGVVLSCLDCFLADCPLYRFQYGENTFTFLVQARGGTCSLALADPPDVVLHRANYLVETGFGLYDVVRNNCEDFALYLGLFAVDNSSIGRSGQAASFFAAVISYPLKFVMANPLQILASAGVYFYYRYAKDIGVRKDVVKIAVEDLAMKIGLGKKVQEAYQATCLLVDQFHPDC
ncbi:unnamed protein product [Calypogeia fissa]